MATQQSTSEIVSETQVHEVAPTGIAALGINTNALAFQVVNFVILLVILKVVAYKPIIAMLENRRIRIEESLEKAKQIEETHAKLEEKSQAILTKAKVQSEQIIKEAKEVGESVKTDLIDAAKKQQEAIVEQTKNQIESEKEKMITDAKKELGYLVVKAASRVIEKNIDTKANQKLVATTIGEIE